MYTPYHYRSSYSLKKKRTRKVPPLKTAFLLAIVFASCCYGLWSFVNATTPGEALSQAYTTLSEPNVIVEDPQKMQRLIRRASSDSRIGHWGTLMLGKFYEQKGSFTKAAKSYQSIASHSPASLDAQVSLVRLSVEHGVSTIKAPHKQQLSKLRKKLKRYNRLDLNAELLLTEATKDYREKRYFNAASTLQELRRRFPSSNATTKARALARLIDAQKVFTPTPAFLVEESKLLIKEGDLENAEERLNRALESVKELSSSYYEITLTQAALLDALGQKDDAEIILQDAKDSQHLKVVEQAHVKLIKRHWNNENPNVALQLITDFQRLSPSSPQLPQLLYYKGRILEELKQYTHAKATYGEIVSLSDEHYSRARMDHTAKSNLGASKTLGLSPHSIWTVKALKQLAWISYLEQKFSTASKYFSRLNREAKLQLRKSRNNWRTTRTLTNEMAHAKFWEQQSNAQAGKKVTPITFSSENYYSVATSLKKQIKSDTSCNIGTLPEFLTKRLELLHAHGLKQLVAREIDWFFARNSKGFSNSKALHKAHALSTYHHYHRAISSADSISKSKLTRCAETLQQLRFPYPLFILLPKKR